MTGEAMFHSAYHAIQFAFMIPMLITGHQSPSCFSLMPRSSNGPSRAERLTRADLVAQAGMILGALEHHLHPEHKSYLIAWHSFDSARDKHIFTCVNRIIPLLGMTMVQKRLIDDLARRYFDHGRPGRKTQQEIADKWSMKRETLRDVGARVDKALRALGDQAYADAEAHFERTGLIPPFE